MALVPPHDAAGIGEERAVDAVDERPDAPQIRELHRLRVADRGERLVQRGEVEGEHRILAREAEQHGLAGDLARGDMVDGEERRARRLGGGHYQVQVAPHRQEPRARIGDSRSQPFGVPPHPPGAIDLGEGIEIAHPHDAATLA